MELFIDNIIYIALISTILLSVFLIFKNQSYKSANGHFFKTPKKNYEFEIKLRAYERLIVFLERIEPVGMINRLQLHNQSVDVAHSLLIKNIILEYEYNVSQQVYISDDLWEKITAAKNKIINSVSLSFDSLSTKAKTDDLIKVILQKTQENIMIINYAKNDLKKELRTFL